MGGRGGIQQRVDRHLEAVRAQLPERLRAAYDGLLVSRGLLGADPEPYFAALGHPLFELPVWVHARLDADGAAPPADALDRVLGASALGYLHARAQDDWLDGDSRDDPRPIALAETLLARSTRLLAAVVGDAPRFWARYEQLLDGYAEALLHTEDLRRGRAPVDRATFVALLAQSRPLALPSLALLERADRWELAPQLERLVVEAAGCSQLVDDLLDSPGDRAAGQRTWSTEVLDAGGGDVDERLEQASAFHERTARTARALGLRAAEGWLEERRRALAAIGERLRAHTLHAFTAHLERAVRGAAGEDGRWTPAGVVGHETSAGGADDETGEEIR